MLRTSDFNYHLPEEQIASHPLPCREDSRMMVLHRKSGKIEHRGFRDLPEYLQSEDLAVLNNSKVIRARIPALKGKGELLLIEDLNENRWICMVRPGKAWRVGSEHPAGGTSARVEEILPGGERIIQFGSGGPDLARFGCIPLPPYIRRAPDAGDEQRYQNIFAGPEGSVAAPTAGLHFSKNILEKISHDFITLHVGPGTFMPVKTDVVEEHRMHEERYIIPDTTAKKMNAAGRILAVGTTVTRVLESQAPGPLQAVEGRTAIFIYPPFEFQRTGMLLTNFHLPQSTLLMLVCAFAGTEFVLSAYGEAVREKYRFFSYGDCMLLI